MKKLLLFLVVLFLAGCAGLKPYEGTVITPDGKVYRVEQNKPGSIEVEDTEKKIKIKADTKSKSFIDKLSDMMMIRTIRKIDE